MECGDWLVYPWQVDAQVTRWQERYAQYVSVETLQQYTRHHVHAITVTDRATDAQGKVKLLFFVPHAHEPAGTAACMNFIQQVLSGQHLDGAPSTLMRERILQEALLTFIPDGNPYGRSRCPEPVWEGRRYNNREFINMVFGIGALYSDDPLKPRWERFKRVGHFSVAEEAPARIGLVYEQIGPYEYIEPNRGDPRGTLARLVRQLTTARRYDGVLNLHQTEFEGRAEFQNCMVILPALQSELPRPLQEHNWTLAEAILANWRGVGGHPTPLELREARPEPLHAQSQVAPWAELVRSAPMLTIEIQNNSPQTPAEQQLLLMDTAIWTTIALTLDAWRPMA
jgi:hypothetical protein